MNRTYTRTLAAIILVAAILLAGCSLRGKNGNTSQAPQLPEDLDSLVMLAKLDLSLKTGVEIDKIDTVSVEQINFSDTSLGVREPGVAYEEVVTPGLIIKLDAGGEEYEYRASGAKVIQVPDPGF